MDGVGRSGPRPPRRLTLSTGPNYPAMYTTMKALSLEVPSSGGRGVRGGKMPSSIEDVAKRAKVSISTVSRVINRRELVNEETCKRVEAAIRDLRYRPNAFARGLMLRKSGIVGLVLPDLHGEFYSEVIRGANLQAREMGHNLLLSSSIPGDDAQGWLASLGQHALLDGLAVMVSDTMARGIGPALAELNIPIVVLDGEINGVAHDTVVIDQRQGAQAMMEHLLTNCHDTRVIFVGGLETNIDTQARYQAYCDTLRKANRSPAPEDVYYLDYTYESAYRLALKEVKRWVGPNHAVFAANDEMAAGIIAGANAQGVSVPQQLAVVGFDDTRVAQLTRPLLTTVRVPMSSMGATAIELLCRRIAEPELSPSTVSLPAELVVRDSCGHACQEK
jgi:LacI family transcriptional regulator